MYGGDLLFRKDANIVFRQMDAVRRADGRIENAVFAENFDGRLSAVPRFAFIRFLRSFAKVDMRHESVFGGRGMHSFPNPGRGSVFGVDRSVGADAPAAGEMMIPQKGGKLFR